jgi:hypothetical protein
MASLKQFSAFVMLAVLVVLMMLVGLVGAALAQAPKARQVTAGCTDTATSKDYGGTIVWRSASVCSKIETLLTCSTFNSGKWIQVVDGQGTAAANPITLTASGGGVSGPVVPVRIDSDRNAYVLTCDGSAGQWLVTAVASASGVAAPVVPVGTAMSTDPGIAILISPGLALLIN